MIDLLLPRREFFRALHRRVHPLLRLKSLENGQRTIQPFLELLLRQRELLHRSLDLLTIELLKRPVKSVHRSIQFRRREFVHQFSDLLHLTEGLQRGQAALLQLVHRVSEPVGHLLQLLRHLFLSLDRPLHILRLFPIDVVAHQLPAEIVQTTLHLLSLLDHLLHRYDLLLLGALHILEDLVQGREADPILRAFAPLRARDRVVVRDLHVISDHVLRQEVHVGEIPEMIQTQVRVRQGRGESSSNPLSVVQDIYQHYAREPKIVSGLYEQRHRHLVRKIHISSRMHDPNRRHLILQRENPIRYRLIVFHPVQIHQMDTIPGILRDPEPNSSGPILDEALQRIPTIEPEFRGSERLVREQVKCHLGAQDRGEIALLLYLTRQPRVRRIVVFRPDPPHHRTIDDRHSVRPRLRVPCQHKILQRTLHCLERVAQRISSIQRHVRVVPSPRARLLGTDSDSVGNPAGDPEEDLQIIVLHDLRVPRRHEHTGFGRTNKPGQWMGPPGPGGPHLIGEQKGENDPHHDRPGQQSRAESKPAPVHGLPKIRVPNDLLRLKYGSLDQGRRISLRRTGPLRPQLQHPDQTLLELRELLLRLSRGVHQCTGPQKGPE